jgi:hypothetical protein
MMHALPFLSLGRSTLLEASPHIHFLTRPQLLTRLSPSPRGHP